MRNRNKMLVLVRGDGNLESGSFAHGCTHSFLDRRQDCSNEELKSRRKETLDHGKRERR